MIKHRYPSLLKIITPLFIILGGWVTIELINSRAKKLDRDKAVSPPPQQISSVCTTVPENPPAKYLWRVVADKVNISKKAEHGTK